MGLKPAFPLLDAPEAGRGSERIGMSPKRASAGAALVLRAEADGKGSALASFLGTASAGAETGADLPYVSTGRGMERATHPLLPTLRTIVALPTSSARRWKELTVPSGVSPLFIISRLRSSSIFLSRFSIFPEPEPLPWKLCESCFHAWE